MTGAIGHQIDAFADSVMREHHDAMAFKDLQDLMRYSPHLVRWISETIHSETTISPLSEAAISRWIEICKSGLRALTALQDNRIAIEKFRFIVSPDVVQMHADALLELRDVLAELGSSANPPDVEPPSVESCQRETFVPERWFQEDVSGLR